MGMVTFIIIFLVSIATIVAILYWQWKLVRDGKIEIKGLKSGHSGNETPITIRDIGILLLYVIKHTVQFIIVQLSKVYFLIMRKLRNMAKTKNPKVAKIINKIKVPKVSPQAKSFVRKTIEETKQKVNRVKQDLAHLEESIEKRVD